LILWSTGSSTQKGGFPEVPERRTGPGSSWPKNAKAGSGCETTDVASDGTREGDVRSIGSEARDGESLKEEKSQESQGAVTTERSDDGDPNRQRDETPGARP